MTQINLLPWREEERQTKKIIFGITLAGFIVLTIVTILFIHIYLKLEINTQKERSGYLQSVMDQTQSEITALKAKEKKQALIQSKINLVINLRKKSFDAVRLLNLLIAAVPKTIVLEKVSREGNIITIGGFTDSDLQTTLFMRNIAAFKDFKQPVLNVINMQKSQTEDIRHFQIKVEQQD